jgi:hypothetical protein
LVAVVLACPFVNGLVTLVGIHDGDTSWNDPMTAGHSNDPIVNFLTIPPLVNGDIGSAHVFDSLTYRNCAAGRPTGRRASRGATSATEQVAP